MEYIILEDFNNLGKIVFKACYKSKKRQAKFPAVPWQIIATFYWKEVADAYLEFCNKYGHLNLGKIAL